MVVGISVQSVNAEENAGTPPLPPIPGTEKPLPTLFRANDRERTEALRLEKGQYKKEMEERREGIKTTREDINEKIKEMRELQKKEMEKNREAIEKMREEGKDKIEALREEFKKEKDAAKAKIKEERITGRLKAFERFTNVESRITELKDKVNANILKAEAKGVDTAKAKAFVVTAETALAGIKTKVTEVNALLAASTNQLTAETKASLVKLTQDLQALVKTAHQALNDANKSLRDAVKAKIQAEAAAAGTVPSTNTTTTTGTTN